ncbi:MAG: hypothetical protein C4523_02640 [Myxococcales bacterium]|nr:MAG: hypothetical protein C4523_02640 [Myxococcales bacterium]
MKIWTGVAQGSDEWLALRLGIPTASNFHRVVTKKKAELSAQAADYALRLVAERLLNMPTESSFSNPWMERGKDLEDMAVQQYQFQFDVETVAVSFITTDDGSIGCSPDRLVVGSRRVAVEIKCPSPHVHLGYLLDGMTDDYKPQVQGQILVAELERADLYAFHPHCPPALIQTAPDEPYIAKLSDALKRFCGTLDDMHRRALALGAFQPLRRVSTPALLREVQDINAEFRRQNEKRFIAEGFTV